MAQTHITPAVNAAGLLASAKHLFSTSCTFLGELMQNARRAGASAVHFTTDQAERALSVEDDGCGISDFTPLLTLAQTGWDDDVRVADNPFGIGFFSAIYAAESVLIQSCGSEVEFTQLDVMARKPIAVKPSSYIKPGTRIVLRGIDDKLFGPAYGADGTALGARIEKLSKGFGITVTLNGKAMERPHALHEGFKASRIGDVRIDFARSGGIDLYLQGLPIGHIGGLTSILVTVHLNTSFQPRMPDRSELYDADEARARIFEAVKQFVVAYLADIKARIPGDQFVAKYWRVAEQCNGLHLFDDVPFVPGSTLSYLRDLSEPQAYSVGLRDAVVSRADILPGGKIPAVIYRETSLRIYEDDDPRDMEQNVLLHQAAHAAQWLAFAPPTDQHWCHRDLPRLDALTANLEMGEITHSKSVCPWNESFRAQKAQHFAIVLTDADNREVLRVNQDALGYLVHDPKLLDDTSVAEWAVTMCSLRTGVVGIFEDFEDDRDTYREDWYEGACNGMLIAIGSWFNGTLAECVRETSQVQSVPIEYGDQMALVAPVPRSADHPSTYLNLKTVALDEKLLEIALPTAALIKTNNPDLSEAAALLHALREAALNPSC